MNRKVLYTYLLLLTSIAGQSQNYNGVTNVWGGIEYKDNPWVENVSKDFEINHGLYNRHISLWASHGRYYDNDKDIWKWQRPLLYQTTEDLFTQTIVVPYLIPMLENSGAVIFTPRERDWQKDEVIVDNDNSKLPDYLEVNVHDDWKNSSIRGFAFHDGNYHDGDSPFSDGTARYAKTTKSKKNYSLIAYQPNLKNSGKYAVYVSYQTLEKAVPDAEYIVYHKGGETRFHVNQQMGGGTWVYLGTFEFETGRSQRNRVVITNHSRYKGVVSADAVRFGGGMGNIERGGKTSGMPRCLEGARYYAQWAGAPYSVYSSKGGSNDYGDDINVRPYMTNWLAGGSCYVPTQDGKKVPIELSLAIHSDAGINDTGLVGSLAVCTTNFNEGRLSSGISRQISKQFAKQLLDGLDRDLPVTIKKNWARRYLWDRNYSETRNPEVPSAILETLSHENFNDMLLGQDPNFKFAMARSIYKTIARFSNSQHGEETVIEPLAPQNFKIEFNKRNTARLSWKPTEDKLEPTARPKAYIVYCAIGRDGFDNGRKVKSNKMEIRLLPGLQYNFKVTAINEGGESFPTETLSAVYEPTAKKTILIINGFDRLSSPDVVNNDNIKKFDLQQDPGLTRGLTAGWAPGGTFIAGNDFNYTMVHADAIAAMHKYNVVSCSAHAVENNEIELGKYACIDLILGLQKYSGYNLKYYKTFPVTLQRSLLAYKAMRGKMIVSGSYVASDMQNNREDKLFLSEVLKLDYAPSDTACIGSEINGLGMQFDIYRQINSEHYAVTAPDIIQTANPSAICAMQYSDGSGAAVAYKGSDYSVFTMGFPFEAITSQTVRRKIMNGIIKYLNIDY